MSREIVIEPMTRIEGHLGIQAKTDDALTKYVDAHSFETMFRGFEKILKGREPADAIWITQRICGVCPVPHSMASATAVDMVYQAPPPPMGTALRNLILASEELYDSPLGCIVLEGTDYSQAIVRKHNPDWWKQAQRARAEHADLHGYLKISEIMEALNPVTGALWLRSLELQKIGRKMASLLGAKHPHVNTVVPGGVAVSPTPSDLEAFAAMLSQHVAFAKEFVPIFDDLCDFISGSGYEDAGARPTNLISYGVYEDVDSYDACYQNMPAWGEKRMMTPGAVIEGQLITTDLVEINLGVREQIPSSYYDAWQGVEMVRDALGNEVAPWHPWNKETNPNPGPAKNWKGKYSWGTSPRWQDWKKRADGASHVLEAGPIARMWVTAKAGKVGGSTGDSVKFRLPEAVVAGYRVPDELEFEWKVPSKINAIERIRARAYFHAYSAYVAYNMLLQALDLVKAGKAQNWFHYKKPSEGEGVGMVEAMRGALGHWVVMRDGLIHRYQVITPSTWNASPRDTSGRPGPYEEAIIGTPITEKVSSGEMKGVDVVRVVRSFDPCIACSVHVYTPSRSFKREIDPLSFAPQR